MSSLKPRKKAKVGVNASSAVPAGGSNPSRYSPRPRASFIAVYNFKGGCGKTFITRELAATAAKDGRKVGMVDADPQCNLTSWWLPSSDPFMGDGLDSKHPDAEDDAEQPDEETGDDWETPAEHVSAGDSLAVHQVSNDWLYELAYATASPLHAVERL